KGGTAMREAFLNNVPPVLQWWDKMLAAFVDGTIGKVAFRSSIGQPGANATMVKLLPAHKGKDPLLLSAPSLGDCQTWAFAMNWQGVGAKAKRRLILEVAAPDNAVYTTVFGSARNHTNPFVDDGESFGKYGDWYVSWTAASMEDTFNGVEIRPQHYLLLRHLGEPPASKAAHTVRAWYVDPEWPISTKELVWPNDNMEPKLITYSVTGSGTCDDTFLPYETSLYADPAATVEIARGGASFLVPDDGAYEATFNVQISGEIDEDSYYRIKQYRLRVYYHSKSGETREEYLGTYSPPIANINQTVTLGANDAHVFVDIFADEELKDNAPGGIYSLRSWFGLGTVGRYEGILVKRYGAKAGSRQAVPPAVGSYPTVLLQDGVRKTVTAEIHPAPPAPAPVILSEPNP
ncbi:MAG: hypothetical protein RBU25_07210, partial [Lentisphaeria bacterium]|nr:hypothetical protein [Lentisphaeria bacterium]